MPLSGLIVEQFNEQARMRHKKQFEEGGAPNPPPDYTETCIHLAACSKTQVLACLTAQRYFLDVDHYGLFQSVYLGYLTTTLLCKISSL